MVSEHDIKRIKEFLKEKDIQCWLWDIDGMARAMDWASKELVIDSRFVFSVLMDIVREMDKSDDPEILKTKPEPMKEFERQVYDVGMPTG